MNHLSYSTKQFIMSKILFFIISLFVIFSFIFGINSIKAQAADIDFDVTYSELKCGTPVTFTVNLNNPNGANTYKYYLNYVSGYVDGTKEYVADPSRLPGYQVSNNIDFTFYASGNYELRFYVMETTPEEKYNISFKTIYITINDPAYPSVEVLADQIVTDCLDSGCTTDYEKALYFHDYLINNTKYDRTYIYCGAEGALARGLSICESYHRAYCMLLRRVGIETGRIENRNKLYHVWTAVKLDGEWYQVDCTWDDKDGSAGLTPYDTHLYFGVNTDIMDGRSSPNKMESNTGSFSDALACNYLIKSGHIHEYSDMYRSEIQSHINSGDSIFTINITNGFNNEYYYNTNNALFYPAAYQLSHETWTTADGKSVDVSITYSALVFNVQVIYPDSMVLTLPSGYSGNQVFIDGIEYSFISKGDKLYYNLTDHSAATAIVYKYNSNNVPTGMYVWALNWNGSNWTVTALPGLEDLISYHGFSIRTSGKSGIRFKSGISTSTKQKLTTTGIDGYKLVEIGSIYMNNANRSTYPFIKGGEKVSAPGRAYYTTNGVVTDSVFETVSGRDRFANVLTGLPSNRYSTELAFRSYVILKDSNGKQIIIYGPIVSRSIYTVAKQVIARGDFKEGSSGYIYLNSIIKTVEGK